MSFDQLTIIARDILTAESEAIRLMDGQDTDHTLATMDFLFEARKVRESIYSHPNWK